MDVELRRQVCTKFSPTPPVSAKSKHTNLYFEPDGGKKSDIFI